MLKILRQIRQKLLKEGNLRKYLAYGAGEIILVVIGILLALQINNWNQDRIDRQLEQTYLRRIHQDLVQDSTLFQSRILAGQTGIKALQDLMTRIYAEQEKYTEVFELDSLYGKGWVHVFNPQNSTYIELESTGSLNIIRNTSLRDALVSHNARYRLAEEEFRRAFDWITGLTQHLDRETSLIKFAPGSKEIFTEPRMFSDSDWNFLNDPTDGSFKIFERASAARANYVRTNIDLYTDLLSTTKDLMDLLAAALE